VLELWANELERRSRLPPSLPSRDQQDSLSDEAPDPLRMMDDAQVESGVFGSGTDVLPDIVRPFRSVSDVLQLAMHELYELNSVLCQKKSTCACRKSRSSLASSFTFESESNVAVYSSRVDVDVRQ
jgi:hypothetical protein